MDIRVKDKFVLIWTAKETIIADFFKSVRIETNQNIQVEKDLKNLNSEKIPVETSENTGKFTVVKKDGKIIYKPNQISATPSQ